MKMTARSPARGFTLVEMIVSMVVLGILSAMVAVFIRAPILAYREGVDRAEITDQADLALRRMARDIRLALPNSVRVWQDGSLLEFLQTRSGARYLAAEDNVDSAPFLDFEDASKVDFTAIAPPASFTRVVAGDYVVVFNLGEGFEPANAYAVPGAGLAGNIARITARVDGSVTLPGMSSATPSVRLTLAANPFASQEVPLASPDKRFQVVSGPVSFYCETDTDGTNKLWRAWGYGINKTFQKPSGGQRALVATRLTTCSGLFSSVTTASQRAALVGINLELRGRNDSTRAARLVHQVHIDNTP
jgi:MSHA biogenesis protein MshO